VDRSALLLLYNSAESADWKQPASDR